jgi:hypothetical protein
MGHFETKGPESGTIRPLTLPFFGFFSCHYRFLHLRISIKRA